MESGRERSVATYVALPFADVAPPGGVDVVSASSAAFHAGALVVVTHGADILCVCI